MATRSRQPRILKAGPFQSMINSFRLHLNAEGKSPNTVVIYTEAAQWFAAAHLLANTDHTDWSDVTPDDVRAWMVYLLDHYSDSYANNQYRALQQFFKWYADEEETSNPMVRMTPPKVGEKVVPVFTEEELNILITRLSRFSLIASGWW